MNSPIVFLVKNDDTILARVQSQSQEGLDYGVDINFDEGTCYCDCPHFQYRLQTERFGGAKLDDNEHHCKHIQEVLNYD